MKLLRYGEFGKERPGVLDKDGQIRDLSDHIEDLSGSVLNANSINKLKEINVENLPAVKIQLSGVSLTTTRCPSL